MGLILSACASTNSPSNGATPANVPEVNGYMVASSTTTYGDGRIVSSDYTLDSTTNRIFTSYGDFYEFDEFGAVTKFTFGNGSKVRSYLRDGEKRILRRNTLISGKPGIDVDYEYRYAKLTRVIDNYPSGAKFYVNFIYDESGQLKFKLRNRTKCSFIFRKLSPSENTEIAYDCGDELFGRYHVDGNGNVYDHYMDSRREQMENTDDAKLNAFRISWQYRKTASPIPNIQLLNLQTNSIVWAPIF